MCRENVSVARCTVARLMRDLGLQVVIRGKPKRTTIGDKRAPCLSTASSSNSRHRRRDRERWPGLFGQFLGLNKLYPVVVMPPF
ncbi:hypothetical protein JK217_14940 [Gluconobacter kondonii]|nr:hypothetical protein [Gluconobacter kondonii]